ncbi:MAG: ABC transporter permease, partial [Maribacter sp.]
MKEGRQDIDITKFLPHRPPMLMVSTMPLINDSAVITNFEITKDCIFVTNNYLTEPGLIENAAQTCSAIVGQSYFLIDDLEGTSNSVIGYISAIKKVVIHDLPKVGEILVTKAELISRYDTDNLSICTIS